MSVGRSVTAHCSESSNVSAVVDSLYSLVLTCRCGVGHWRVVSLLSADIQSWDAFRGIHFQSKLSPLPVLSLIARMIADHVLVFQFDGDLGADVFQFVNRIREECTASG